MATVYPLAIENLTFRYRSRVEPAIKNISIQVNLVTIHAIAGSKDIIDAMDLRAFGIGARTWLQQLTYRRRDRIVIGLGLALLLGSLALSVFGLGKFRVPAGWAQTFPILQ